MVALPRIWHTPPGVRRQQHPWGTSRRIPLLELAALAGGRDISSVKQRQLFSDIVPRSVRLGGRAAGDSALPGIVGGTPHGTTPRLGYAERISRGETTGGDALVRDDINGWPNWYVELDYIGPSLGQEIFPRDAIATEIDPRVCRRDLERSVQVENTEGARWIPAAATGLTVGGVAGVVPLGRDHAPVSTPPFEDAPGWGRHELHQLEGEERAQVLEQGSSSLLRCVVQHRFALETLRWRAHDLSNALALETMLKEATRLH
jgi:hypothetical protein